MHTPIPWKVGGGKYLPIIATTREGQHAQIGRLESFGHISDEEVEANGAFLERAVNAHTYLLEACQELVALCDNDPPPPEARGLWDAYRTARAAVAKATA